MPGGLRYLDRRLVSGQDLPYRRTSGKSMRHCMFLSYLLSLFWLKRKPPGEERQKEPIELTLTPPTCSPQDIIIVDLIMPYSSWDLSCSRSWSFQGYHHPISCSVYVARQPVNETPSEMPFGGSRSSKIFYHSHSYSQSIICKISFIVSSLSFSGWVYILFLLNLVISCECYFTLTTQ